MQKPNHDSNKLSDLMKALNGTSKSPPLDKWNPPYCGEIDMEIKANGQWFYMGTPIGRAPLVKLFASVLWKEGEDTFLKTPVEKIKIRVEDAEFLAVEMKIEDKTLLFRTLQDEWVAATKENPLEFRKTGEVIKPYIEIRRGLYALVNRPLFYDLMDLGFVKNGLFGVVSNKHFFEICKEEHLHDPL